MAAFVVVMLTTGFCREGLEWAVFVERMAEKNMQPVAKGSIPYDTVWLFMDDGGLWVLVLREIVEPFCTRTILVGTEGQAPGLRNKEDL